MIGFLLVKIPYWLGYPVYWIVSKIIKGVKIIRKGVIRKDL